MRRDIFIKLRCPPNTMVNWSLLNKQPPCQTKIPNGETSKAFTSRVPRLIAGLANAWREIRCYQTYNMFAVKNVYLFFYVDRKSRRQGFLLHGSLEVSTFAIEVLRISLLQGSDHWSEDRIIIGYRQIWD